MPKMIFLPNRKCTIEETVACVADIAAPQSEISVASVVFAKAGPTLTSLASAPALREKAGRSRLKRLEILDVASNGMAALVDVPQRRKLPTSEKGTFHPLVTYVPVSLATRLRPMPVELTSGLMAAPIFTVQLVDATTGAPVADALTSLSVPGGPQDVDAYSDDQGKVRFRLRKRHVEDARLLVQPGRGGHWGLFLDNVDIANGDVFKLESVDLDQKNDCLRQLLRPGHAEHGRGVKVGILDSGVGPHPDLPNVTGDLDNSRAHGTHVAGIIGGRGAGNKAGVAPGVSLMSYQIADDPETGAASNFQIFSAVSKAIDDGCDIINLSFKDENETDEHFDDPVLSSAIRDACDRGILCVAAAGNDGRRHVAFPARHPDAVSVAALGWEPGLPQNAYDRITINDPRGRDDGALFFGSFSNIGTEGTQVDIVAPGVGVVSTIPGGQYVPLSGTSMACPATVGMVARLLGERPDILNMERSRPRMEAIKALLFENSSTSGFDREYEGHGMPHDDWSRATV